MPQDMVRSQITTESRSQCCSVKVVQTANLKITLLLQQLSNACASGCLVQPVWRANIAANAAIRRCPYLFVLDVGRSSLFAELCRQIPLQNVLCGGKFCAGVATARAVDDRRVVRRSWIRCHCRSWCCAGDGSSGAAPWGSSSCR